MKQDQEHSREELDNLLVSQAYIILRVHNKTWGTILI